jgi:DNA repair exonuclease SbcCD ATPase subunit
MKINQTNMEENKTWVNPNIRVIWEDHPENITQDKIKDVRQYFARKYGTTNVNVITKVKYEDKVLQSIDVSSNILDINYQNNLIRNLLETNSNLDYYDKIMEINNIVENKLVLENQEPTQFNKWYIKRIRFSNFLSFGENQELDFEKLNGITIVESTPQNTGGKTTLTIDLLLFLFFNTTTKSSKSEDIFNKFTNKDTVQVVGDIIIDGEEYMISRRMDRKKNKTEEWKVKSELSFDKKLKNGEIQNLKGEQRRETELFIKNTIGNMDDFLATILTTGNNLEDLLESKPTARGQLLGRFLGLEHLKKKEDFGKEVYQEFSKRMFSNVYNVEKLKTENLDLIEEVKELETNLEKLNKDLKEYEERLEKGNQYKNELYTSKYSDIDKELLIVNVESLEAEIATINANNFRINDMIKAINADKPENFYDEDEHDALKEKIMDTKLNKQLLKAKIDEITKLIKTFGNGIQCEHCGLNLIDAEFTKAKVDSLDTHKNEYEVISNSVIELEAKHEQLNKLKKDFDAYEKNKLIIKKHNLSLEANIIKIENLERTIKRYLEVQEKIKKNNQIDSLIIKANSKIDELNFEKNKITKEISGIEIKISNYKEKTEKNLTIIEKIYKEQEEEKQYKIYLDLFGKNGISKMIMKTMLPVINSELQRLLLDVCYFTLDVRVNDKNEVEFVMIDNNTGVEKLMTTGSGYEKTVASLALRAVLSKVCSLPKPNIWVADEVFGKVSNENLDMMGEFFIRLKSYFEKILLISHNPLISNWGESKIVVEKKNNVSKVLI